MLDFLEEHHDLFLDWEKPRLGSLDDASSYARAMSYDRAIYGLHDVLQAYALIGWHCTRLTTEEIADIISNGMSLPNAAMLFRRIDAVVEGGLLSPSMGVRLKTKNQADEPNRAGVVCFCFFPPREAGEHGINRLVRFWGGEALYNSHERDPETAAALSSVGVPAMVEAEVPIALLRPGACDFTIVRRFLIWRGYQTDESCDFEDRIKQPLPAACIRRVIQFPESDFLELSGCASWRKPLTL